jgi:hypothetical protein
MHKDIDTSQMRFNVILRPWRVVCVCSTALGVETIKYTIEAESWNKAYLKASDEIPEFASILGVSVNDIKIESVTGLPVPQKSSE